MTKKKTSEIFYVYKVVMPSWFIWPGRVSLHVSYTYHGAQQFIEDYPNKWLAPYLTIEPQELIAYEID